MTYDPLEDLYLLDSGRKVKRLELLVYGAPPAEVPFRSSVACSPPSPLTKAERFEVAGWLCSGLIAWANQDDQQADTSEANVGPRLIVLDRTSGALA